MKNTAISAKKNYLIGTNSKFELPVSHILGEWQYESTRVWECSPQGSREIAAFGE